MDNNKYRPLSLLRNLDMLEVYNNIAHKNVGRIKLYEQVINSPAKRYYITARQAYKFMPNLIRGNFDCIKHMRPLQQQQYVDLLEEVCRLADKPSFRGKSLHYIVKHAVLRPAPRFYVKRIVFQICLQKFASGQYRHLQGEAAELINNFKFKTYGSNK